MFSTAIKAVDKIYYKFDTTPKQTRLGVEFPVVIILKEKKACLFTVRHKRLNLTNYV